MKDLITKSFLVHSRGAEDTEDQEKFMEDGKIHNYGSTDKNK